MEMTARISNIVHAFRRMYCRVILPFPPAHSFHRSLLAFFVVAPMEIAFRTTTMNCATVNIVRIIYMIGNGVCARVCFSASIRLFVCQKLELRMPGCAKRSRNFHRNLIKCDEVNTHRYCRKYFGQRIHWKIASNRAE